MANKEHIAMLKLGVQEWNRWRDANRGLRPDLSGAYLSESSMQWARKDLGKPLFEAANFSTADFSRADLNHAILKGANLRGTNLEASNLIGANLRRSDLSGSNLCNAKLNQVNFTLANLFKANLDNAIFWETILSRTNLSDALWLDRSKHGGPSIIDHRTIKRSGAIPRSFLQGCGLPDSLIDSLPSILSPAGRLSSVFISHSSKDHHFAKKLYRSLQDGGVRCWFAPHNIEGGKKLDEQIDDAIASFDRVLLLLSESSMSSEWVRTEIANARQREIREQRRILFPITLVPFQSIRDWRCFDADTGKDSAREIREYFIPDFSGWRDEVMYAEAFQGLIAALKKDDDA